MKSLFVALLVVLVLFSCQSERQVTIKTEISDPEIRGLLLSNEVDMIYDTIISVSNAEVILDVRDEASIFQVSAGRIFDYLYVEPGAQIRISKNPGQREFTITSSHQAEQSLVEAFSKEMEIASSKYSLQAMTNGSEKEFLVNLEEKYGKVTQLLAESGKTVSTNLIKMLQGRIAADRSVALIMYPQYFKYYNKRDADLSENYYAALEDFNLDDEKLYYFSDVKAAATAVVGKGILFADYDGVADFFGAQYQAVTSKINNEKVSELLKYDLLSQQIQYAGGISGFEDDVLQFVNNCKDPTRKAAIEGIMAHWAHLKVGNEAPDFSAFTRDGEEVSLKDLRGKNVYIDVWATWCGPCIAEIPSLKSMEAQYHGKNVEFVSVSIDKEKDRQKWMNFVKDKDLGGTQLMTKNEWSSDLTKQYNINGIPRFIMIDGDGNIVDVNAPRPSNSNAFNKMMDSVLN